MQKTFRSILLLGLSLMLALTACGGKTAANQKVTITLWDYYGEATPLKPLVAPFMAANPDITIDYQALDWDTTNQKLDVVLTGGTPPDVVTIDMTWLPKLAALGAFTDLKALSGGKLNGVAWADSYTPGGLEAITYNNKIVAALYDFDTYALYYRADLFQQKGLQVPKTWDELLAVAKQLHEGDKYYYEFDADTFHGSQWIYENGGSLMSADNKTVVFNSPEAVQGDRVRCQPVDRPAWPSTGPPTRANASRVSRMDALPCSRMAPITWAS